jgi:thiol-disulfide isomerase/thioredoxin
VREAAFSIVKATAPWCAPCRRAQPVFLTLCSLHPDVEAYELDIEAAEQGDERVLLDALQISSIPTFIAFSRGVEVARYVGFSEEALTALFADVQTANASGGPAETS